MTLKRRRQLSGFVFALPAIALVVVLHRNTHRAGHLLLVHRVERHHLDLDWHLHLDSGVPQLQPLDGPREQRQVADGRSLRPGHSPVDRDAVAPACRGLEDLSLHLLLAHRHLVGRPRPRRRTVLRLSRDPELHHSLLWLFAHQHEHAGIRLRQPSMRSASRLSSP